MIADQRAAIARQRDDLDRLDGELIDLEATIAAAGRASGGRKEGPMSEAPIRVLFVCTGNRARSQIAEAVLRRIGGADFEVFSAGVEPKGVNPYTVRVLGDAGIDWSQARSKSVEEFLGQPFDYVITVCDRARQTCPVFPGVHNTLHWGLEDPTDVEGSAPRNSPPSNAPTWKSTSGSARSSRWRSALPVASAAWPSPVEVAAVGADPGRGDRHLHPGLCRLLRDRGRHPRSGRRRRGPSAWRSSSWSTPWAYRAPTSTRQ
jgi:arsenate reductase